MNPPKPLELLAEQAPTKMGRVDPDVFIVDTDNAVFDLKNSTVTGCGDLEPGVVRTTPPDAYFGRAIIIRKAKNVTIKNVKLHGFKIAIYAEDSPGLRLENCDVSENYRMRLKSTPQREHRDDWIWPHKNDENEWLRYGAGIYLLRCDDARIINCRARNGQNGICLSRCNGVEISGNDMSFMSGWGLALYRSNKCRVLGNCFDYCVRGYSHGVYNRGQDSAGILVFEQSSDNVFAYNSATHGGDGFFLYGGDETLKVTGKGGCNRNVLYKNDFSHSVMHGIEATFSEQNVFVGNTLAHCENGIWAGYSRRSTIAQNKFSHCKTGVAIEHGRENNIEWNDFVDCKRGIWLWWDEDVDLLKSAYATQQGHLSENESIAHNFSRKCDEVVLLSRSTNVTLMGNRFEESKVALRFKDKAGIKYFRTNTFVGGLVENDGGQELVDTIIHEEGGPRVETKGKVKLDSVRVICAEGDSVCRKGPLAAEQKVPPPPIPAAAKFTEPSLPRGNFPQPGRDTIFIDEWGPYDYVEPRLFPAKYVGSPPIAINVLGPLSATFKVLHWIDPNFEVSPMVGDAPGLLTITPRTGNDAPKPGAYPIELDVKIGKSIQRLSGTVIVAPWNVRYFKWDASLDPLKGDDNWRKIIAAAPIKTEKRDNLDLPFGGNGPTPEVKEHFALTAETRLSLLDGKWRLRTISDDGVRVYFDGKRMIDNWTWHVPTEDAATVDASPAGPHNIRVEYFEINGHAQLQFFIEPVDGR